MTTKNVLPAVALCVVVAASIFAAGGVVGRVSRAQSQDGPDELVKALRRGGLREAAKLKGHYSFQFDPHWDFGRYDIEALTKKSAAVIVGVPAKAHAPRLAPDGQLIFTDYDVAVREVVKGKLSAGDIIKVSLVGGRFKFEDDTSAEVETPTFEHVKPGRTYAFFLSEGEAGGPFVLTGGPQGLAELGEGEGVKSHGRHDDPIAVESQGMRKEAFLREVRKRGKEWPEPAKCCR